MPRTRLLTLFFCWCWCAASGQSFYVSTSSALYKVTKTPAGFASEAMTTCSTYIGSVAMNQTGLYWMGTANLLQRGTVAGTRVTDCKVVAQLPRTSAALTAGPDGKLYFVAGSLYATDPATGVTEDLGPPGFNPSGDLTFFNGGLYMAVNGGIAYIDIHAPSRSYMYLPLNRPAVFGLVSLPTGTNQNTVYAFSNVGNSTDVIELDLVNRREVGLVGTLPYDALDAASPVEDGTNVDPAIDLHIQLGMIDVQRTCAAPGKARVQVNTGPHATPYTYQLGDQTNLTGVFDAVAPGVYTVTVTSVFDQQTTSVTVPDFGWTLPTVSVNKTDPGCTTPGSIALDIGPDPSQFMLRYKTATYAADHVFTDLPAGEYTFTVIDNGGCIAGERTVKLVRNAGCDIVAFPNTFTPNHDGVNDMFLATRTGSVTAMELRIYDRWGEQVFVSRDIAKGWNGEYRGKPVPGGTYFWVARVPADEGGTRLLKGSVTVIR